MKSHTLKISEAKVYSIKLKNSNPWADITIREWNNGGSFQCQSDYGDFSYIWNSTGTKTLREFLLRLDYGYFMRKAHQGHGYTFCSKSTSDEAKKRVMTMRREMGLSKEDARSYYISASLIEKDVYNEDVMMHFLNEYENFFEAVFYGDYQNIFMGTKLDPQANAFWEKFWPILKDTWTKELEEEYEMTKKAV